MPDQPSSIDPDTDSDYRRYDSHESLGFKRVRSVSVEDPISPAPSYLYARDQVSGVRADTPSAISSNGDEIGDMSMGVISVADTERDVDDASQSNLGAYNRAFISDGREVPDIPAAMPSVVRHASQLTGGAISSSFGVISGSAGSGVLRDRAVASAPFSRYDVPPPSDTSVLLNQAKEQEKLHMQGIHYTLVPPMHVKEDEYFDHTKHLKRPMQRYTQVLVWSIANRIERLPRSPEGVEANRVLQKLRQDVARGLIRVRMYSKSIPPLQPCVPNPINEKARATLEELREFRKKMVEDIKLLDHYKGVKVKDPLPRAVSDVDSAKRKKVYEIIRATRNEADAAIQASQRVSERLAYLDDAAAHRVRQIANVHTYKVRRR